MSHQTPHGKQIGSTPGNQTTSTPGNQTTSSPGNQTTSTPGNQTTSTPGNQTTSTPGNQTTSTPGNQKTPTFGKQLSSSLRERLKKCGRYHASPQSLNTSVQGTVRSLPSCPREDNNFLSPVSRKRSSTSPVDEAAENPKQTQKENNSHKGNVGHTKKATDSVDNKVKETEGLKEEQNSCVNRTPLSSRLRSIRPPIKSSRLNFQSKDETSHKLLNDMDKDVLQAVVQIAPVLDGTDREEFSGSVHDVNFMKETDRSMHQDSNTTITISEDSEGKDLPGLSHTLSCDRGNDKNGTAESESLTRYDLIKEIANKEETLRKLKMVKTYRSKNNLIELQLLIDKWREVSQQALQDLQSEMTDPRPTLTQLISHLGIEHDLIKFDMEEETFD